MPYKTCLTGLRPLYRAMKESSRAYERFQVNYARRVFDCVFYIDSTPFELLIGLVGDRWATVIQVENGFMASMKDADFYALCRLLDLNPGRETFTSAIFLKHIAMASPDHVAPERISPRVLIDIYPGLREQIDEADKIHFVRWAPQGDNKARNFSKTEKLVGKVAADFCRKHNISSCWTADPAKAKPLIMPWE